MIANIISLYFIHFIIQGATDVIVTIDWHKLIGILVFYAKCYRISITNRSGLYELQKWAENVL